MPGVEPGRGADPLREGGHVEDEGLSVLGKLENALVELINHGSNRARNAPLKVAKKGGWRSR